MDLSGVIFVLLALAWAGYLIPKALRHSDEAARTRAIDRFSPSTRVLARREPVDGAETGLVLGPPASVPSPTREAVAAVAATQPMADPPAVRVTSPAQPPQHGEAADLGPRAARAARATSAARRRAARSAARRRRRILTTLLLVSAAVGAVVGLGQAPVWVPVWSPAVPTSLTLAYLVLCRTQVRRSGVSASVGTAAAAGPQPFVPAQRVPAPTTSAPAHGPVGGVLIPEQRTGSVEPLLTRWPSTGADSDASLAELESVLASRPSTAATGAENGSTLWDPLPLTLPTYVTKPKARRTVRTIELGEPGTWTSGRIAEDAEVAARATDPVVENAAAEQDGRRAVGS